MGKTVRHQPSFDDEHQGSRRGKHHRHANNRKTGGMKYINVYEEDEDDIFDDDVTIEDEIIINKTREK